MATLFALISSEQISSSQRLAGSYRFLINVVTDFSRLGLGWGLGLGWKWRTGRREAGQRQRRKMQAGLHLDYEIFITCLLEWGQHRSPATASPPDSALKCTGPGGRGHHSSPHLLQKLLREGAEEVKKKEEETRSPGFRCPFPSFLICSSPSAFDGGILIVQVGTAVPWVVPHLPLCSRNSSPAFLSFVITLPLPILDDFRQVQPLTSSLHSPS